MWERFGDGRTITPGYFYNSIALDLGRLIRSNNFLHMNPAGFH